MIFVRDFLLSERHATWDSSEEHASLDARFPAAEDSDRMRGNMIACAGRSKA